MTQSAIDFLEREVEHKRQEAREVVDAAEKDGRGLTDDEKQKVERIRDEVEGDRGLKARITEFKENERVLKLVEDLGPEGAPAEVASPEAKTIGDAFVMSDAFKAFQAKGGAAKMSGHWKTEAVELPYPFGAKATVTSAASPVGQPDVQGGILGFPTRRITVTDLLTPGTTDGSTVRYLQETANTNATAAVAEGVAKPESTIVFAQVDEPVRKIATFLPVSDEMLEDVSQLRSYLDGRLRIFVQLEEERQLLLGDGTAPNISGILDRSGIQTGTLAALKTASGATTPTVADAIYHAMTVIRTVALLEPDGIVMHPTNWEAVRLLKDANLQYHGGGPFTAAYGNGGGIAGDNLWNIPVAVTPAITLHTALVGAFKTGAQYFRRGGLTVEASNSHADFFQLNLTAIRAEERLALAVYRPAAFHAITALNV